MVTIENKPETKKRIIPASNLDLTMQSLEPKWQDLNPELKLLLQEYVNTVKDVDYYKTYEGILQMYTRDARLGNLSKTNNEFSRVTRCFELAGELLMMKADINMSALPFLICLNKGVSILELSSSKGGFARIQMNTIREENISEMVEAPKRGLFMPKQNDNVMR